MKRTIRTILLSMVFFFTIPQTALAAQLLIPGGQLIGLELSNSTVTIAAFDDVLGPGARDAGLRIGDRILSVDGQTVTSAEDVRQALNACSGQVRITVLRDGRELALDISPAATKDGRRLGVYLRQGIAGVGTVTFYDPDSHTFGSLGHGVNDASGKLLRMHTGRACAASVASVKKGTSGDPGQIRGNASVDTLFGTLTKNTHRGIFGTCTLPPAGEPLPVASFSQVHTGPATIRSTVSGSRVQEYSVEIVKIYPEDRADCRNFLIRITDPELLKITGGIVQGMGLRDIRDNTRNA